MTTTEGISLKLFIGCLINSEVKMHLNYSSEWKQEQVIRSESGEALEKVRHAEKEYVGRGLSQEAVTVPELEELDQFLRSALARYCPELDVDKLNVVLIPQLFLS
jgi:hypothetical protein